MTELIGVSFTNKDGLKATVVNLLERRTKNNAKLYKYKFKESGYEGITEKGNLTKGYFKDYGSPTVYEVGYSYPGATKNLKVYKTWSRMLERCYSPQVRDYHLYKGKGVKVSNRWLYFSNFEEDIKQIEGYKNFIESNKLFEYSLDKDIKGNGLLYSKETCCFTDAYGQSNAQERVVKIESTSSEGIVRIHDSVNKACRDSGVQNANLYKVLNGERKNTLGYTFKRLPKQRINR